MDWYLPLKLVHVLAAIVAVGTNLTYFIWLALMRGRSRSEQVFALESIMRLDARVANPAYVVLPITGIVMVLIGDIGFTTFWIAVAIGLYVLLGVLGGALFAPAVRRQAALAETEGPEASGYEEAAQRTRTMGILTMLPVAGILYLMVLKPTP